MMQFRVTTGQDIANVADVLSAAAADLQARDLALWAASDVDAAAVASQVRSGLYHLGLQGAQVVGVFRLEVQDPLFWPEMPAGTSCYLHKLAVHPKQRGQGVAQQLLQHAVALTRGRGLSFLRLDCMGGRPRLRAVYDDFGFRHHSQIVLGGQLFERFELSVGAPAAC